MNARRPEVLPAEDPSQRAARERIAALARLLDTQFELFGVRYGWDALIGLIPGIGDVIATLLSAGIVLEGIRLGAPGPVIARMLGNLAIEGALGAVPLAGDVADVFFKGNVRNARILLRWMDQPVETSRRSRLQVALVIAALVLATIAALAIAIAVALRLARWLGA